MAAGAGVASCSHHLQPLEHVSQLSVGWDSSCALVDGGTVWCWGQNDHGQIDSSGKRRRYAVRRPGLSGVVELAAASCARRGDGTVLCWGERGGKLHAIDGLRGAQQILASNTSVCGLLKGSRVACADRGYRHGVVTFNWPGIDRLIAVGESEVCGVTHAGAVECAEPRFIQISAGREKPGPRAELSGARSLSFAGTTLCEVTAARRVDCASGTTSTPFPIPGTSGIQSVAMGAVDTACALGRDHQVTCWHLDNRRSPSGSETSVFEHGSLHVIKDLSGVTNIGLGAGFGCALGADHRVRCWGSNMYGNLGTGEPSRPSDDEHRARLVMRAK